MESLMARIRVQRKILRWGNGFGIRLTKADLQKLQLRAGSEAQVTVSGEAQRVDLTHLRWFRDEPDVGRRHDELLGEALDADH